MKLMKKSCSMLLAFVMVFTGMFGCMTAASFADSGTGDGAPQMTGFSFDNVEGPESGEVGQTISLNIQFDKNIKILDAQEAVKEIGVKLNGKDVAETPRDITLSASENILNIKMVSNDSGFVAVYAGLLSAGGEKISNIVSVDDETKTANIPEFSTYIPIGIKVENTSVAGTDETAASVSVKVTHRANMRGMYHFQLMSNGAHVLDETSALYFAGAMTSHAHNFNTTITKESIASAMATQINNANCGYTAEYQQETDTFTVTAGTAKAGEIITVQMFEANADCRDQKALLAKAKAQLDNVENKERAAVVAASAAYDAFAADESPKTQMDYINIINRINECFDAPEIKTGASIELTGVETASVALASSVPEGWLDAVTSVKVKENGSEGEPAVYTAEQAGLSVVVGRRSTSLSMSADMFRTDSTTSGKKEGEFTVTISAADFEDCTATIAVKNYGAEKFYIRYLDKNGKVVTSKAYTMAELKAFSKDGESKVHENAKYQSYCSMAGLRTFCADGVYIEDLLEDSGVLDKIKDSDGNIKDGIVVNLRTNDSVEDGSGNDSTTDNAYYWMGKFDYKNLFQDRYYFPAVFTNEDLKARLLDGTAYTGDTSLEKRQYIWENGEKVIAERPMIAWNYDENVYSSDQTEPTSENYKDTIENERSFRFLFSLAKDSENEATENTATTFSVTYCAFGIDITDTNYTKPSSSGSSGGSSGTTVIKYNVNKPADTAEGKVSVNPSSAAKDSTITITVTPADGYKTASVTVTDKNGSQVTVSGSENKYTFKMPASDVTVKVTYEKTATNTQPESKTLPFKDVASDRWSYEAVKYAYENSLFSGTSSELFSPASEMTRAMLVTVLYRMDGSPAVAAASGFTDVADGMWYSDAVAWAKANNIVSGVSSTEFAPENNITREQLAVILYRYAAFKSYDTSARGDLTIFTDSAKISAYAKDAVSWAVAEKLISGVGSGKLVPDGNATREQVAVILQRFAENVAK